MASGQYTMGPKVAAFEEAFAAKIGTKYAVMVNSGSSANLLMVAAYTLRHGPGTVIVPAVSWATSYSPFQQYGWKLVFVDIDDSLNMDPALTASACEAYPSALVLAVHLLGNPCEMDFFLGLGPILEDNCESLGAKYDGQYTGSFGEMGTHSLFFSHHLCTMEGGVITTNDRYFADLLRCLRSHGWTRHLSADNALGVTPGAFDFIVPGYNVRPLELQGALGLAQLDKLDELVAFRRANAASCPLPLPREVGESSWYGFATPRTPLLTTRCETRPVVAGNFTKQPTIAYYDYEILGDLPMANRIHDDWCYIGNSGSPIDWQAVLG
jgi:CDP-6-deoxy-D-xylo-4-hexulose-3-dehydrase